MGAECSSTHAAVHIIDDLAPAPYPTEEEIHAVIATWEAVEQDNLSLEIGRRAFLKLFVRNPASLDVFFFHIEPDWQNGEHFNHHCRVVVKLLGHVVKIIRDKSKVDRNVSILGAKHPSFTIDKLQFDLLGEELITALSELLGDRFTPIAAVGWRKIYDVISGLILTSMQKHHEIVLREIQRMGGRLSY